MTGSLLPQPRERDTANHRDVIEREGTDLLGRVGGTLSSESWEVFVIGS